MSIERKDVRVKLDADDHAGLQLLAECDQTEMARVGRAVAVAGDSSSCPCSDGARAEGAALGNSRECNPGRVVTSGIGRECTP
jgi:hypothetical protein